MLKGFRGQMDTFCADTSWLIIIMKHTSTSLSDQQQALLIMFLLALFIWLLSYITNLKAKQQQLSIAYTWKSLKHKYFIWMIKTNWTILNRIILKFPHLGPQLPIGIHSMGMIWWALTCNITHILPGHLPSKETTL